jgi:4-amino-4-deoxy-L-arabinose transferase
MNHYFQVSSFTPTQNMCLTIAALFFALSFYFHLKSKNNIAVLCLIITGASLFAFGALLDPFLNFWDERFHALVAKSMLENPFHPKLYLDMPIKEPGSYSWVYTDTWVHKQPVFLWQIALSFKIFGVSEFTLRLPSIIMATLMILLVYRMAALLMNKNIAYYAALSVAFSWFIINLVSGKEKLEHNDICFAFYATASLWALIEYFKSNRKWRWVFIIGLLAGLAILTKWLLGLLVFAVWGLFLLSEYRFKINQWKTSHFLMALATCVIIFLPWQLYIFHQFPEYAAIELNFNTLHYTTVLEGHDGSFWFHFSILPYVYFGQEEWWNYKETLLNRSYLFSFTLLIVGFILFLKTLKKNSLRITVFFTFLCVYLFFSFSKTKMPAYTLFVSSIFFMSLAAIPYYIERLLFGIKTLPLSKIKIPQWIPAILMFFIVSFYALYMLNFKFIRNTHLTMNSWRMAGINAKEVFTELDKTLPEKIVIFNVASMLPEAEYFSLVYEGMFYGNRICYQGNPLNDEIIEKLNNQGYAIAIFTHIEVPQNIQHDERIIKIDKQL